MSRGFFYPLQRSREALTVRGVDGARPPPGLPHLLGGAGSNILVRELLVDPAYLVCRSRDLLFEPCLLGAEIDDAGERQCEGSAPNNDLSRAARSALRMADHSDAGQSLNRLCIAAGATRQVRGS